MSVPTEFFDLFAIDPRLKRVWHIDQFGGMETVVGFLRERADRDLSYSVGDIGGNIRAVGFFSSDNLLILTNEAEVVHDGSAGG